MNISLKNKILHGINEAVYNVLSTDINDQDIDFNQPGIDNNFVHALTLDEIYMLFMKNPESIFATNQLNSSDIALILDNDTVVSLSEYNYSTMHPVFLKITNKELTETGNEILIMLKNKLGIDKKQWQVSNRGLLFEIQDDEYLITDSKAAINDFNGYDNSQRMLYKMRSQLRRIPAVKHCKNIKSPIPGYKGYLPTAGQLFIINKYINMITYILDNLHLPDIQLFWKGHVWWSSTERDRLYAWTMYDSYIRPGTACKNEVFDVLPLFKKV